MVQLWIICPVYFPFNQKEEINSCEEHVKKLLEIIPPKGKEFLKSIEHILEREKNWVCFLLHMVQVFFTFIVETYTTNGSHPLYLEKVWWKRDGCLAFEKPPFEKKPGQAGGRKRYATCLRHRAHCQSIVSIDYLVKTCLDLSRKG